MISISIVEDNVNFKQALIGYLQSQNHFLIKGAYPDAQSALTGLITDRPDIAIVDIRMPGMTGIELISAIQQHIPATQYLVCTIYDDDETVFKALEAGASGYVLKNTDADAFTKAIIELHNGGSPMSPYIARKVISKFRHSETSDKQQELTEREHEILVLLAQGLIYKEIADRTDISTFTVKNHLKNIYRKLHVQNKVEALKKYKTF